MDANDLMRIRHFKNLDTDGSDLNISDKSSNPNSLNYSDKSKKAAKNKMNGGD